MPASTEIHPRPRADAPPELPELRLRRESGRWEIDAPAGSTLEALNTTRAPTTFLRLSDAYELGRAEGGVYRGSLGDAGTGDRLRIRARTADGRVSPWLRVRMSDDGPDLTAAFVNLSRIRLENDGGGHVRVLQDSRMPVTEEEAQLRFRNRRTGEVLDTQATSECGLRPGLRISGQTDDEIEVAVSDGAGNTDLSLIAGVLRVPAPLAADDLPDPAPLGRDSGLALTEVEGEVFAAIPSPDDVKQGPIPNCYVPASLAAVAEVEPEALLEMVQPRGRRFTVRIYDGDGRVVGPPRYLPVDRQLYLRNGVPAYETSPDADRGARFKLWVPIIGKAIAQWKGSYDTVARGGSVGAMMSAILGRPNVEHWCNQVSADQLWQALVQGRQERRAMAVGTHGQAEAARYYGSPLVANHAYSIHGLVVEPREGAPPLRQVRLRNPWANGPDRGYLLLPVEELHRLGQVLNVC